MLCSGLSDNHTTILTRASPWPRTILYGQSEPAGPDLATNHALDVRPEFIHQTWVAASFMLKDAVVRAYRTDPVQLLNMFEEGDSVAHVDI
ncbi:hypothetical protein MLD38_033203 [Melastoma candidum]|uniref:Uncharacterized protein n=1 Tax=Melastoma candidum TaxID=119954 RepID=A0ACB9M6J6_9MYRT|nr:hypothetical protein MLD38_033203 [Melastoma candidum]